MLTGRYRGGAEEAVTHPPRPGAPNTQASSYPSIQLSKKKRGNAYFLCCSQAPPAPPGLALPISARGPYFLALGVFFLDAPFLFLLLSSLANKYTYPVA
jgi:hypothetical protein